MRNLGKMSTPADLARRKLVLTPWLNVFTPCDWSVLILVVFQRMNEPYDYLFKFLVIGSAGTGKSCLLHQFIENRFKEDSSHTIGRFRVQIRPVLSVILNIKFFFGFRGTGKCLRCLKSCKLAFINLWNIYNAMVCK